MTLKPDLPPADARPETMSAQPRPFPPSRLLLGALAALVVSVGILVATGVFSGAEAAPGAPAAAERVAAEPPEAGTMAPLPKARPKLVQPEAGRSSANAGDALPADAGTASADDTTLPKVTGPASVSRRGKGSSGVSDLGARTATALPNGVALPPLDAPEAVLNVIRAGNIIARSPYKWGGGHGRFQDNGYDCSGSVSYALYYAGLVDGPHTSGDYAAYGKPGRGKWITIYANGGHMWMEVAGIRFDTSGARTSGSRWQNELRNLSGYEIRHPPGL